MRVFFDRELDTVATYWRIYRRDGAALGFTSHNRDLTFSGLTHRAAPGMIPAAICAARASIRRRIHGRSASSRINPASGNSALALIVERLWAEGGQPLDVRIEQLFVTRGRKRDNIAEHRAVLDAIRSGDATAARRAMRTHLVNAERQRMSMGS